MPTPETHQSGIFQFHSQSRGRCDNMIQICNSSDLRQSIFESGSRTNQQSGEHTEISSTSKQTYSKILTGILQIFLQHSLLFFTPFQPRVFYLIRLYTEQYDITSVSAKNHTSKGSAILNSARPRET